MIRAEMTAALQCKRYQNKTYFSEFIVLILFCPEVSFVLTSECYFSEIFDLGYFFFRLTRPERRRSLRRSPLLLSSLPRPRSSARPASSSSPPTQSSGSISQWGSTTRGRWRRDTWRSESFQSEFSPSYAVSGFIPSIFYIVLYVQYSHSYSFMLTIVF